MPKTGTSFSKGNSAARKEPWTEDQIRAYQKRVRAIVEALGLDETARLLGYQKSYVKLIAGFYQKQRQPSEEFCQRFENAELLHHIRTVVVPFLREREPQVFERTWTRRRARIQKSRQKRR